MSQRPVSTDGGRKAGGDQRVRSARSRQGMTDVNARITIAGVTATLAPGSTERGKAQP